MNILILCTGNSCRSQMAEAFCKTFTPSTYTIYSAGIEKHGLNPSMLKVMSELGYALEDHYSKTTEELPPLTWDLVITVCDHAQKSCPFLPAKEIRHIPFPDPPKLEQNLPPDASLEDKLDLYRKVRDEIKMYFEKTKL